MADIHKLITDRSYLRSVLIHATEKLKRVKNTSVVIDTNIPSIAEIKTDETNQELCDALKLDRTGNDFDIASIYRYESKIINVLKYITKKYNMNTIEQIRFNYFNIWAHSTYKIINKSKSSSENVDIVIIGFVINNKIFEVTLITHHIAVCQFFEQEYLTCDGNLEYKIKTKSSKTVTSIANAKLRLECSE